MNRGAVIWVDLCDAQPPELGKTRPAVVLSNSVQNLTLNTIVVVPLSSQPAEIWPLRVEVTTGTSKTKSFAVVPGIRQVRKSRLRQPLGKLSAKDLARLDDAVRSYLSD